MNVLVTFPGRAGDLLWALPSVRALSRRLGQPIDLAICGEFASMVPLLERQPYLGRVYPIPTWGMSQGWAPPPLRSPEIPDPYELTLHAGYRRWPELPLPFETLHTLSGVHTDSRGPITVEELHLEEPWITNLPPADLRPRDIAVGFSETHFELKVGLVVLLEQLLRETATLRVLTHDSRTRWFHDRPAGSYPVVVGPWHEEAAAIQQAQVFLGCNSGLHVLAVAVGTSVVLYEPMEARHNPIFFPLGWDGPQVQRVVGLDGGWTTDVRHTAECLRRVIERGGRG